ncbi:Glycosyltransferase family 62 protein [[Candida] zeylanoides]
MHQVSKVLHAANRRLLPLVLGTSLVILLFVWVSTSFPSTVAVSSHSEYFSQPGAAAAEVSPSPSPSPTLDALLRQGVAFKREFFQDHSDSYSKVEYINQRTALDQTQLQSTVLILSSIGTNNAYGRDRSFEDLVKTLFSLEYPKNMCSLGFLVGTGDEFERLDEYFKRYFDPLADLSVDDANHRKIIQKFVARVTLLIAPFIERDFDVDRADRHNDGVQHRRRKTIARSRNFLLTNALRDERYTLFVDSDIVAFRSKDMLKQFVASGKDIIVPRIEMSGDADYDRNSWRGERATPSEAQLAKLDSNDWEHFDFIPHDAEGKMHHLHNILNDEDAADKGLLYNTPLDSVGGAVLFSKSIVYKQGVIFPPFYLIGTTWGRHEGYDGIETEGLCYMARTIGYQCWGFLNLVADHSPQ